MGLTCVEHSKIGLLGTMLFLGWMASSMIVPGLSDIYGRKKFFIGFHVLQVAAIFGLLWCSNVKQALALLFALGFSGVGRSPIVYIYLLEMLTPQYQKVIGPIFASSVGICLAGGTFLLQMMTKDAVWCFYASLILSVFAMFFSVFFIPESPKYLHATGQFDECRKVLSYMAVCNGEDSEKMANVRFTQEPIAQP